VIYDGVPGGAKEILSAGVTRQKSAKISVSFNLRESAGKLFSTEMHFPRIRADLKCTSLRETLAPPL